MSNSGHPRVVQLKRLWSCVWPALPWVGAALFLFWPVLPLYWVLPSPDSAPLYPNAFGSRQLDLILKTGGIFSPHDLLWIHLPSLVCHDLTYLVDTLAIAAGGAYLLRGRNVPYSAAWFGGGVLAFAGYSFTLVSAGHRGFFEMGVYAVFMLACVLRAMEGKGYVHFAIAGACAGWSIKSAPDMAFPYLMFAVGYGCWLMFRNAAARLWSLRLRQLLIGLPMTAVCFGITAYPSIRAVFTTYLPQRDALIASSSGGMSPASAASPSAASAYDKWVFATNWSLPPEEVLEFVAPCVLGTQTGDPTSPYWGRLGRTDGWEEHQQGFPNFRQHTVYVGAVPLCLAGLAVWSAWRWRRRRLGANCDADDVRPSADWRVDVPFWSVVAVAALLFAFGRYAPFYRVFYELPYMSSLRAPVKFVRFFELATAVLAAIGAANLSLSPTTHHRILLRPWMRATLAVALTFLLLALFVGTHPSWIATRVARMGLSSMADTLRDDAAGALVHAAICFGAMCAVLLAVSRGRIHGARVVGVLAVVVAIDTVTVNRQFIQAIDMGPWYRVNKAVEALRPGMTDGPVIANHVTPRSLRTWLSCSLNYWGVDNCVPISEDDPGKDALLLRALGGNVVRLWELSGASFALVPSTWSRRLPRDRCEHVSWLELAGGALRTALSGDAAVELVRVRRPLPYASLSQTWSVTDSSNHLERVAASGVRGHEETVVSGQCPPSGGGGGTPGRLSVRSSRFRRGSISTRIEVEGDGPQMLTVRERTGVGLVAFLDGRTVPILQSGYLWTGVFVPPGRHEVTIRSERRLLWPVSSGVLLAGVGCVIARRLMGRKRCVSEETGPHGRSEEPVA